MSKKPSYPYVGLYQKGDMFWVRVALRGGVVGVTACDRSGKRLPAPRRPREHMYRVKAVDVPLKVFDTLIKFTILFCTAYNIDFDPKALYE